MNATTSDSRKAKLSLEEIFSDAETRLRDGMEQLGDWSNQVSQLIEKRPGSLVAGIAIAGFITGLVMRGGVKPGVQATGEAAREPAGFMADPFVAFISGAVAGFVLGPKLVENARYRPRFESNGRLTSIERH